MLVWELGKNSLKLTRANLGTFDTVSGEYNLTLKHSHNTGIADKTLSFNESSKGWVSFKSFIPDIWHLFIVFLQGLTAIHEMDRPTELECANVLWHCVNKISVRTLR